MAVRLGLDASQPYASCAVSTDLGIVASLSMERPIENFPALIRNTLSQAHVNLEEIDEIVVCIGPGSQTGVRSAVVTGNALALALDKPVTGVIAGRPRRQCCRIGRQTPLVCGKLSLGRGKTVPVRGNAAGG